MKEYKFKLKRVNDNFIAITDITLEKSLNKALKCPPHIKCYDYDDGPVPTIRIGEYYQYVSNEPRSSQLTELVTQLIAQSVGYIVIPEESLKESPYDVIYDGSKDQYCVVFEGGNRFEIFDDSSSDFAAVDTSEVLYFPEQLALDLTQPVQLPDDKNLVTVEISKETYEELKRLKKI